MTTIAEFPELLDQARSLADKFALSANHYDETGNFPFANFDQLFEAGLLKLTASGENGGLGGGLTEAQAIVAEIARGEPSTALVLAMHYSHHNAISRGGKWPKHLVDRVSAANLEGPALINSAQVEPRVGSPSHGSLPDTVARRQGDVWRISGHKNYATGIPGLKFVSVLAVTDEPEPRLASFLVPASAKGVHMVDTWNATGMRATSSHDISLDDVEIPLQDIIDPNPASEGLKRDEGGAGWYFLLIASVYHGVARAAGNWIIDFAASYSPGSLGQPIATAPRIQDGLGEIEYRLAINERLLRTTAEDVDAKRPVGLQPAFAKHQVIENAVAVTTLALDLGGNPGLKRNHPLERHHRDALCGRAHAPQNNMIRTMGAKAALARRGGVSPAEAAKAASQPAAQKPKLAVVGS
jgi:alkylation response protein AidB-like acyl-CoA dehydrogenase